MQHVIDMPLGAGPCAKQTVAVLIVGRSGRRYLATNYTLNPQAVCPRGDMPTGFGYSLCREVCQQPGHAEINALRLAGDDAAGGRMVISGHTYACQSCRDAAGIAGITKIEFV